MRPIKPQEENSEGLSSRIQGILRRRLTHNVTSGPTSKQIHSDHSRTLLDLLSRTALYGERNSVILVGPRGSGKTFLLQSVLDELTANESVHKNLMQVHLNGLLQTDDRFALKEITRQLQLENTAGDKVFGSFAENLQFLLESLKSGNQDSKSILFILDEFDLFCHHKNQTLLYNLFDVSQSAQTPVIIIGLTCRMDVIELLEKRVKSRFSHRQMHIFSRLTFEDYVNLAVELLTLSSTDVCGQGQAFHKEWNKHVKDLLKITSIVDVLRKTYDTTRDIRTLKMLLLPVVGSLTEDELRLSPGKLMESYRSLTLDSKSAMLAGLSVLELCLIIAMRHLTARFDGEPFSFQMMYNEYSKFTRERCSVQNFQFSVVMKAFEHLQALEFVKPVTSLSKNQKEFQLTTLLVEQSQIAETLQCYPGLPTEIQQWAGSSIV